MQRIALTGESCCSPSISTENEGGCCSGNDNNTILQPSQSAAEVAELVGYGSKELKSIPEASNSLVQDVAHQLNLHTLRKETLWLI